MKEVTKEITRVEKYTIYQAVDGTEFKNQDECERYEASAKGVLRGRFMKLAVCPPQDAWSLMGGYDDHQVVAIMMEGEADKDVVKQTYYLDCPSLLREDTLDKMRRERFEAKVEQAFHDYDILLFGLNCEDGLYLINTRNDIISNLKSLDMKHKDNE